MSGRFYVFPASRAQQRLYFLQRLLGADAAAYGIPLFFAISGPLDVEAMAAAVADVQRRHEALRTHFAIEDTELVQVIDPDPVLDWKLDEDIETRSWIERESARPFDLDHGPLFRAALLRVRDDEHVLMLAMHHIVADGWSLGVLLGDLQASYLARGPLPDPEFQYADFSSWQDEWLDGPAARRQLAYWTRTLGGALPVLRLPTDRPRRPGVPSTDGDAHRFPLPAQAVERLAALCRDEGCTVYAGLLAVFAMLLRRYTGQDDVVIGSPVANRTRPEFDGTIGLFVNTVAIRCDLDGTPAFRELLRRTGSSTVDAFANQELPFERIVQELNPGRAAEWDPVFQVMFSLHNTPAHHWELPGLLVGQLENRTRAAKFELELDVVESGSGLVGVFQYRTALFDRATVERLARHYVRLLERATADPDGAVSMWSDEERAALLPVPADPGPVERCCHELFAAHAAARPDAIAVTCGEVELTYRELDERANRLAHRLRALGVGPDVLVGLCAERSAELVVGILGIAKAGGAYVPLDPDYPQARLAYLVRDTGLRHVVTLDRPFDGVTTVRLDDVAGEPVTAPASGVTPDHLAYVIHTSGSTGEPKGTLVSHRNVARLFTGTARWFDFGPADVWTLFHSYAFDFSVWELWGALAFGGRLVVVPHAVSRSPRDFLRLLHEQRVTVLNQTPSAFRQIMDGDPPPSLRYVLFGGEALDPATLRPWLRRHGDDRPRLVNMYGITEVTVHATYHRVRRCDVDGPSVIGVPLPDLAACVVDRDGEPVPDGVPGELLLSGAGVARGYLGRPELTAARFVRHPLAPRHPAYRTGDLVRRRADGALEYLGRADDQLKIRGFRVEPGEIEAALVRHPAVREAVVLAVPDGSDRRLVGYVVSDVDPGAGALRDHLTAALPEHLVPSAFVVLDRFPLTRNGKVDRAALAALDARPATTGTYAGPRSTVERALTEVWTEVLGAERVGIDDNYFVLGGDSIRSIRLLAAAARRGLRFALPDLLRHQTIRTLAPHVTTGAAEPVAGPEPFALLTAADRALVPDGVVDAYPLSRLQAGMLYHSELSHRLYHNVVAYLVRAEYSEEALRWALAQVLARHEILRTSFDLHGFSEPVQLVHAAVEPPVTFEDLRGTAADGDRFGWERAHGFHRGTAPLLRLHVQRLGDDTFRLWLAEHHAIVDGWSKRVVFVELVELYLHRLGRCDPPPPPPAVRYRDFVALERRALAEPRHREFWLDVLDGSTFGGLPRLRPATAGPDMRSLDVALPGVRLPRTALLAAHVRVMALLTGSTDVVTGIVQHGRPEVDGGDRVVGLFLNTLPLRVTLPGGTWASLVDAVAAAELAMQPHRRYPMAQIRQDVGRPLFETFVNYTRFGDTRRAGFEILSAEGVANTDFAFGAEFTSDVDGGVGLVLRYDAARFDAGHVERIGGHYRAVLAAMGRSMAGRYDVDLLSEAEHRQLAAWNDTTRRYPQPHVLTGLVALQVARTPDAVACVFEDSALTYAELAARARGVAGRLVELGVRPGDLVGICLPRSLDLMVGLLAILEAGAAYVPLDADDPRLPALLAESGVSVVLAHPDQRPLPGGVQVVSGFDGGPSRELPSVGPDHPAYLIFTSGSTGRPKGVVVSHRAICNRLLWMQDAYGPGQDEAVLQKTPATFDVSVWEFFWPLITGARLVLARPGGHRDPSHLQELIERHRITTVHFVPSMLSVFLDNTRLERCTSLRRVICSGEALPAALQHRFRASSTARLENLYGPTEAAVDVTRWSCDGSDPVPIGRPIANTTLHVLDPYGHPVPVGVPGELYLGGAGLADGYLGRPALTAERFVPAPSGRWYRTGDLVRHRADGALEFLGRTDDQLKIRGFRVEPGEIEAALRDHEAVRDAAVVWHDDRLAGHLVLDRPVEPGAVADWLAGRLPAHLVPSRWAVRESLPSTRNGKVDRAALRAAATTAVRRHAFVAPRDETEARLAALFESVLGTPVGVHDDFLAAGGHSLSALRLSALVSHEFGRPLPLTEVLRDGTVAGLAAWLRAGPESGSASASGSGSDGLVSLRATGERPPLFLVHPAGGSVFCYRDLAAALPPRQPVYALAADGPAAGVEALADRYAERITAVTGGPFRLAGWSFGGVVAYELGRRLGGAVAMIDTGFPGGRVPDDVGRLFAEDVRRTTGEDATGDLSRQLAVFEANLAAHARYRPAPYTGPLLTVHSAHVPGAAEAWRRVADPAAHSVIAMPAGHYELLRHPHVTELARHLDRFFEDSTPPA